MTTTFCPASLVDTAPSPHLVAERLNDGSATPRLSTAAALGLPTMPPLPEPGDPLAPLHGRSIPMLALHDRIRRIATTDATVLISGETGTGKELVARAVHGLGSRRAGAFVALNCGAVSGSLVESELFGHERGSFTGANRRHHGVFSQAHQGTLFLDEVTEMALDLQVRLLRVLETGTFQRIGGEETLQVDVRILAATNQDPLAAVRAGRLREDLYYRLQVLPLPLPPLRHRDGDVELLARHFLAELNRRHATDKTFTPAALQSLCRHSWPGNVRELAHFVEHAYLMADGQLEAKELRSDRLPQAAPESVEVRVGMSVAAAERQLVLATMRHCHGNKTSASLLLGISLKTLYCRLNLYAASTAVAVHG